MKLRLAKKLMKYYSTPFAYRWRLLKCSTRKECLKRLDKKWPEYNGN